ncbi:MAG: DNA translocase FtsK [Bacteroidales bacterium]|nr:DNA translocase FtsK [Bacteroidales bacterium]
MQEIDQPKSTNHPFPPIDLLEKIDNVQPCVSSEEIERNKKSITKVLKYFEIPFKEITVQCGLAYSSYNITLAPPARMTKLLKLERYISLLLRHLGRNRITIPLPGKIAFGIDIVNKNPQTLSLRSLIETEAFQNSEAELPIALGVTIDGQPIITDLSKMPQLLIGGACMQGKTTLLHNIILSLLYKKCPSELKFVIMDPSRYAFSIYKKLTNSYLSELPNLESDIITDTKKMGNALNHISEEMDHRYELLRNTHSRNIQEYNTNVSDDKQLPYLVVVINLFDELTRAENGDAASTIHLLAQIGRAVGIHLIISTQVHDYSVITGWLKANFPSRIAFRVSTSIESRTILDESGAEELAGKGDMLFSHNGELLRLQGALVQPEEIERVVTYIENHSEHFDS